LSGTRNASSSESRRHTTTALPFAIRSSRYIPRRDDCFGHTLTQAKRVFTDLAVNDLRLVSTLRGASGSSGGPLPSACPSPLDSGARHERRLGCRRRPRTGSVTEISRRRWSTRRSLTSVGRRSTKKRFFQRKLRQMMQVDAFSQKRQLAHPPARLTAWRVPARDIAIKKFNFFSRQR